LTRQYPVSLSILTGHVKDTPSKLYREYNTRVRLNRQLDRRYDIPMQLNKKELPLNESSFFGVRFV